MSKPDMAVAVAALFSKLPALRLNKDRRLMLNRTVLFPGNGMYAKLYPYLTIDQKREIQVIGGIDVADFGSVDFETMVETEMLRVMQERQPKTDPTKTYFNESIKEPLSSLKLILNVNKKRRSALYETGKDLLHYYDYEVITDRLEQLLKGDELGAWLSRNVVDCKFGYAPFQPRIFHDELTDHKILNGWTDAAWKKDYTIGVTPECPPELAKFMQCFVKYEEDRRYMLAWLRDCCFGRAWPILVLCASPGVGKNLFVNIAKALVGSHNYRESSRGFANSAFHNNVADCRLFFLDETNLSPQARDTLKSYHNGTAAIERKGVDVGDPEPLHASFVVANNFKEKITLEYTDRKFYAPQLSAVPLLEQMSQEEVDHFVRDLLTDDAYIQKIAAYLEHNFRPKESEKFKKGEFFKTLCINSYPAVFKRFIMACKQMSTFTQKSLTTMNSRNKAEALDMQNYLEHYEKNFGTKLADLTIETNGNWTATSKIYKGNGASKHGPKVTEEHDGITPREEVLQ